MNGQPGPYGQPYGQAPYGQSPYGQSPYVQVPPQMPQQHQPQQYQGYRPVADDTYGPPPFQDASSPGTGGSPVSPDSGGYSPDSPGGSPYGDGSGPEDQFMGKDYRDFTEGAGRTGGSASPTQKNDPHSGVSPRRCTDLVCVFAFLVYILGMLIFLAVVKNTSIDGRSYSDTRRLTHGMDYEARLCGVDPGVEEKKYVFWCRDDPSQNNFEVGSPLNLKHPVCVEECPRLFNGSRLGPEQVECLMRAQGNGPPPNYLIEPVPNIPGGQFGTIDNFFMMFREETAYATTYDSMPLAGRYCVPTNETNKASLVAPLSGPLGLAERVHKGVGSFEDCWLVVFLAVLATILLSVGYVFLLGSLKDAGMVIVSSCLIVLSVFLLLISIFCFLSASHGSPIFSQQRYDTWNVFYKRASEAEALTASMVCGGIFLILSFGALSFFTNVHSETKMEILLEASWSALMHMKSLFFLPPILAVCKFFVMWLVCYNFQNLCAVGMYDDYRIIVEGMPYAGMSKRFFFDPWMWWGIAVYVIGGLWLLEIFTSLGQFVISWCAVIYYFTSKDEDGDKVDIPVAAWKGCWIALRYHAGSILLGAFGIWFFRIFRMGAWIWSESLPHEGSTCCFKPLTACWRVIGKCFDACAGKKADRQKKKDAWSAGDSIFQQYSKDAYQDVTIRTTHFWQAKEKAQKYIASQGQVKRYTGDCRPCTFIGVLGGGITGFIVCYCTISFASSFNDPNKSSFIEDPFMVSSVAFVLCGMIAYDFCALLDHMARQVINQNLGRGVPTRNGCGCQYLL
ncbi:unnamed protein product [Effrenium voratum]|nr:unnamed protein product [Effrenium voratum]